MPRVIVVGGGITGLTIAFRLQQLLPLVEIQVWETSSRLGGCVWTDNQNGFVIEHGPNGFLDNKPALFDLCQELGLGPRLIAASDAARKNRFLFLEGKLQQLPNSIKSLVTTQLLSWHGKLRMVAEPLIPSRSPRPESVRAFAQRRFGGEAADVFIDPLVTGIHGGDPAVLDIRSAFPRLSQWESNDGSVIGGMIRSHRLRKRDARRQGQTTGPQRTWSLPHGLREVIDALEKQLKAQPRCEYPAQTLRKSDVRWLVNDTVADCVVLACPAHHQATLISAVDTRLAELVGSIAYNRIAVVAVAFRQNDVPDQPDGFGFISPQRTRRDILGVQWCSSIYANRAPDGLVLWRALCGGWNRPEILDWPDDEVLMAVRKELTLAHGITADPVMSKVIRWPRAIPQYTVGHPERLLKIDQLAAHQPGLFLAGNAYRGIALNDCVEDAGRVAQSVAQYLLAMPT